MCLDEPRSLSKGPFKSAILTLPNRSHVAAVFGANGILLSSGRSGDTAASFRASGVRHLVAQVPHVYATTLNRAQIPRADSLPQAVDHAATIRNSVAFTMGRT